MAKLTKHGSNRIRKRVGLPKKAVARTAALALERGRPIEAFSGGMRRWLSARLTDEKSAALAVVYGEFVYLFAEDHLITTIPLPPEFKSKMKVKKDDDRDE